MKNEINVSSEVMEKSLDIIAETTSKSRKSIDNNVAYGINKFFELINASPIGIKIETYIAERPYKLKKSMEAMKEKYEKIPKNKRIEPSATIALNVAREFDYYLDEIQIREMFENILISDMNLDKVKFVSPSFIDLVKQLSKEDAKFLQLLNKKCKSVNPIIEVIEKNSDQTFIVKSKKLICVSEKEFIPIEPIVLDNLIRMNFVMVIWNEYIAYDNRYDAIFNIVKNDFKTSDDKSLQMHKGKLSITEFGMRFINICLE